MGEIFGTDKFNVIEDKENYYFFRALEKGDLEDIEKGIIGQDGKYERIRTDRERWEEAHPGKSAKYNSQSEISLEEMYHHIRLRYSLETNCISLSSNAGVAITYGGQTPKFVMVKIPKTDMAPCYNAVQYMFDEMNKNVEKALAQANEEVKELILEIEEIEDSKALRERTFQMYQRKGLQAGEKSKVYKRKRLGERESVFARFNRNQALTEEQQLAKDKLMAKITILEAYGYLRSMISTSNDNMNLIRTFNMSISSMEQIYYGDIPGGDTGVVTAISRSVLDMFSMLQQLKEHANDLDSSTLELLENQIISYAQKGYEVVERDGKILFSNGSDSIEIGESANSTLKNQDEIKLKEDTADGSSETDDTMSIEKIYDLSEGRVRYTKAKLMVRATYYLSKSKNKVSEITNILRKGIEQLEITEQDKEKVKEIIARLETTYTVEPEIVQRKNNRGYQISETVRIDINDSRKVITDAELQEVLKIIDKLSEDERKMILASKGTGLGKKIIPEISKAEKVERNEYYTIAIVESYDWNEIGINFTEEQKEDFVKRLQQNDIVSIYDNLKRLNITESQIPCIALNLCTKEKYANVLEKLKDMSEMSEELLEELSQNLSIESVENFLGYFEIEGTKIKLKEYQQRASENVDDILEDKKFASVILPTGAGKTFVAIAEILKKKYEIRNRESKKKILYISPSNEIISQVQRYLVDYVIGRKGTVGKNDSKIVSDEFPNLEFKTYASLLNMTKKELEEQYELIILDELHRTGAEKWGDKLKELLANQDENVNVLGITATPTRDVDGRDMSDEIAYELGYTQDEIERRKHVAMQMNLIDAIRNGIVVNPRLVSCAYMIKESERFRNLLEDIELIDDENIRKEKIKEYEEYKKALEEAAGIDEILSANLKPGGKYIVFISPGETYDELNEEKGEQEEGNESERKVEKVSKKIREEWLAKYAEENGIELEFFSMLSAYSDKENAKQLRDFEGRTKEDTIKFMVVIDKLNEGVHVNGINGIIWTRPLSPNSFILLQQQMGRCIFALDENNPLDDDEIPVIIDLPNNLMNLDFDRKINAYTKQDDLEILREIIDWVQYHNGHLPDINGTGKEEVRKAIQLKRIQANYIEYKDYFNVDGTLKEEKEIKNKEKIKEIIELGKTVELWEIYLPEKLDKNGNIIPFDKLEKIQEFKVEGILKRLFEFEEETEQLTSFKRLTKNITEIEEWCKETFEGEPKYKRRIPRATIEGVKAAKKGEQETKAQKERRLGLAYLLIKNKYKDKREEELTTIEINLLTRLQKVKKEYDIDTNLANILEIEEWCKETFEGEPEYRRRMPRSTIEGIQAPKDGEEETKEQREIRLGRVKLRLRKKYKNKSMGKLTSTEIEVLKRLQRLESEYDIDSDLANIMEVEEWCKETFEGLPIYTRRMPRELYGVRAHKKSEVETKEQRELRLSNAIKTIRVKYRSKSKEELTSTEIEVLKRLQRLESEYDIDSDLANIMEIEEWCKRMFEGLPIYKRRIPRSCIQGVRMAEKAEEETKEQREMRLGRVKLRLQTKYEEKSREELTPIEIEVLERLEKIEKEYNIDVKLASILEMEEWCKETFEGLPIYKRRLPRNTIKGVKSASKDEVETNEQRELRLGQAKNNLRTRYKNRSREKLTPIEIKVLKRLEELENEYDINTDLAKIMEAEEWCKETFEGIPKYERRMPRTNIKGVQAAKNGEQETKEKKEKRLGNALKDIHKKYENKRKEELTPIEMKVLARLKRLEEEYMSEEQRKMRKNTFTAQEIGMAVYDVSTELCVQEGDSLEKLALQLENNLNQGNNTQDISEGEKKDDETGEIN